jgi:hypothetical protein
MKFCVKKSMFVVFVNFIIFFRFFNQGAERGGGGGNPSGDFVPNHDIQKKNTIEEED